MTEEEAAATGAADCSGPVVTASSKPTTPFAAVGCAITQLINVVTFNYFIDDYVNSNLKI